MSLTAVSVERYLVISQPLNVGGKPTHRCTYFLSLSTWLYSALFASLPLFGVGKYVPEGFLTGCSFDYLSDDLTTRIFILIFFFGAWMIPMSIILYSYLVIMRAVVQVRRDVTSISNIADADPTDNIVLNNFTRNKPNRSEQALNVEIKVAKTIIGLISVWTVAWTPYAVVSLIGISGYGHLLTPFSAMIPALFAKLATCVDPFIYTLNQRKIRNEILARFGLLPPPMNPSAGGANPYFEGVSRRPTNYNNSSRYRMNTGSLIQQPVITGHRRSNTNRAPPYSSIGRVVVEENVIIHQRDRHINESLNPDTNGTSNLLNGDDKLVGNQQITDAVGCADGSMMMISAF